MAGTQMQLEDWLDDLCVRFIINLPQEDLSSVARICFQVEEAQWFYEDFIRPLDPTLPSMSLRTFCLRIFQHCPLLASFSVENHTRAFEEFLEYKTRVPVRGAIMLNQAMDSVVLVKGWKKGASWSFPRGKINKDEDDLDCAIREVFEETGLDLRAAGLVPVDKKPKSIEILMREQQLRLYVFRDIPMDTDFEPQTRKEISKIEWYKLSELPAFRKKGDKGAQSNENGAGSHTNNKFYMVAPFLVPLKKWIASQRKAEEKRAPGASQVSQAHQCSTLDEVLSAEDSSWAPDRPRAPGDRPAIETMSGATQELQRLLKMQPRVEAAQPPQHEDKGSALLSILQAGSHQPRGETEMPHTPLDATISEPLQPRNPHHHTNQHHLASHSAHAHGPPPSFQLDSNPGAASLNPSQTREGYTSSPKFLTNAMGMNQQPYPARHGISLAHPQPLPPHIQRAMLSRSASQGSPATGRVQEQAMAESAGRAQRPRDNKMQDPRTAHLDGHSLALLGALKRGTTPAAPSTQTNLSVHDGSQPPSATHQPIPKLSPHVGHPLPQGLPNLLGGSPRHVSTSALVGSGVGAHTDRHRSALLEMFKRTGPDAVGDRVQTPGRGHSNDGVQFSQGVEGAGKPGQQVQGRGTETQAIPQVRLPAQTRVVHGGLAEYHDQENLTPHVQPSPGQVHAGASGVQTAVHPTHILQRGQGLRDDFGANASACEERPRGRPEQLTGVSHAKAAQTAGEVHGRPGRSDEQKRQLLSLFGRQPSPALGGGQAEKSAGAFGGPGRGERLFDGTAPASSPRDVKTPMSPADQSFLLDYLQTVTNSASR